MRAAGPESRATGGATAAATAGGGRRRRNVGGHIRAVLQPEEPGGDEHLEPAVPETQTEDAAKLLPLALIDERQTLSQIEAIVVRDEDLAREAEERVQ